MRSYSPEGGSPARSIPSLCSTMPDGLSPPMKGARSSQSAHDACCRPTFSEVAARMSALMHWQNTVGRIRAQMTAAASATSQARLRQGSSQGGDSIISGGGDEEHASGSCIADPKPPARQGSSSFTVAADSEGRGASRQQPSQQLMQQLMQQPAGQPQVWDSSSTVVSSLAAEGGPFSFAAAAAAMAADGGGTATTSDGARQQPAPPAAARAMPSPFSGVSGRSAASSAASEFSHGSVSLFPGAAAAAAPSSLSSYPPSSIGGQRPPTYQLPEDMPAMPMPGQPTTSLTPAATAWLNSVVAAKKGPNRTQPPAAGGGLPPASPLRRGSLSSLPEEGGDVAGGSSSGRLPLLLPAGSDAELQGASGALHRPPHNHVGMGTAAPPAGPPAAGTVAASGGAAVWDQDLAAWGHRPGGGGSGAAASAGPQGGVSVSMVALAQASELEECGSEILSAEGVAVAFSDFGAAGYHPEAGPSVGAAFPRAGTPSLDLVSPFASMLLVAGLMDECSGVGGGEGQQAVQAGSQFKVARPSEGAPLQACPKPPPIDIVATGISPGGGENSSPGEPIGSSGPAQSLDLPSPFANLNLVLSLEEGAV